MHHVPNTAGEALADYIPGMLARRQTLPPRGRDA